MAGTIVIGFDDSDGAERALDRAHSGVDGRWVVQRAAALPSLTSPVRGDDGGVAEASFFVVLGLIPSRYGLGVVARASQAPVVNVAQHGGMCALVIGAPLAGLEELT